MLEKTENSRENLAEESFDRVFNWSSGARNFSGNQGPNFQKGIQEGVHEDCGNHDKK
jgi:hypothetical protein